MTLWGFPRSCLSSSVLLVCFFVFPVFFDLVGSGFAGGAVVVCAPGSAAGGFSARASEDPATDTATAAASESMGFGDTGRLLGGGNDRCSVQPLRHETSHC